ncbi:MAG: hypothetical protein SGI90_10240 [Candidatus Eisenbacteria bacterium]|nr:hypothetical protein [Candidatus Eisenbacteria bacterium]
MTRVHRRKPLRLLASTALLSLGACGDDTDSPPDEFSPPTRRGAITVGMGTGLGPIVEMEVASDGTIFANQEGGQIRRFNMEGEDVRLLTITAKPAR